MKISTQLRRMADINDILDSMGIETDLFINGSVADVFWYLTNTKNGRQQFGINPRTPLRDIIRWAQMCDEFTWTKITNVCMQIVGTEVWVDREMPIVIASMGADRKGTHVTSTTGRTYGVDNLYIKG